MLARGASGGTWFQDQESGAGVPREAPEPRAACLQTWGSSSPAQALDALPEKGCFWVWAARDMQAGARWIRLDPGGSCHAQGS